MTSLTREEPQVRYPVVIVGSGPTGLTLANLLGAEGIRALLIERHTSTGQEARAVSIDDESLRTMQALGLVEKVLKEVVPGYGSHYYSPGGRCFVKVEPTETPYGYPRRNAFRQPIFEKQLREGFERTPIASVGPAVSDELKAHGLRTDIYPADEAFFMRPLISAMAMELGKKPPRAMTR